ncbi:GyrI-like domain-containing protein [Halobacteriovorax marinus]|uniref:GyrI-like domain-containing protein n=1 Tax=Halobacteriovorax marinus TaxID=97084 RepID=UPI003A8EA710
MKVETINESKIVYGLTIRTKNENEMNQETAKIGNLWGSFYSEVAPLLNKEELVYGVYSSYESDHSGEFNVTAASEKKVDETEAVEIEAGRYLVFTAQGEMPQAVIQAWTDIWNYFSDENSDFKRLYKTDFELYDGTNAVKVYIGIK